MFLGVTLRGVGERAMGLDDGLRLPRCAPGEEPDGRVVGVRGEALQLGARLVQVVLELVSAYYEDPLGGVQPPGGFHERVRRVVMDQGQRRPGVAVEVLDGVGLQVRVDHDDDGADFEHPEQGRHVLRSVRERDDDALLRLDARVS